MSQSELTPPPSNGTKADGLSASAAGPARKRPESEVVARAQRRRFTTAYKRRILSEADRCTKPGEIGALLRREGLYSRLRLSRMNLTTWRRQREAGELGTRARGKPAADPAAKELKELRQENERLQARLEKAETIIEVQKKLCALLGLNSDENPTSGTT